MSNTGQKYAFENGTVPREPLTEREQGMLDALKEVRAQLGPYLFQSAIIDNVGSHAGLLRRIEAAIDSAERNS